MSITGNNTSHLVLDIFVLGRPTKAIINSGAQGNYISLNLVNKLRLP